VNGTAEVRNFLIRGVSGTATISTLNLTADRTFSLPNSSGTAYITGGTDVALADGGTGASTAANARTNLGLVIGTDVQAFDAQLADIAALSPAGSAFVGSNATNLVLRTAAQTRGDLELVIGTNVQAWDNDLDDIAALTHSGSAMIVSNGTDWLARGTAQVRSDLDIVSATLTKAGLIEIATAAETTTGTDATRAVSPSAIATSDYGKRIIQISMTDPNAAAIGYGTAFVRIDSVLNNYRLVAMEMGIATGTASTGGGINITPRNITKGYNMVSTPVWVDSGESDSLTAATAVVIVAGSASVSTGDKIRLSVGGTGTATGMIATMIYQL